MKIATWNLGGLRRHSKLRGFRTWCADFDIILLQETFLHERSKKPSTPGFHSFSLPAKLGEKGRPVGGLATLIAHSFRNVFDCFEIFVSFSEVDAILIKCVRKVSDLSLPNTFFVLNVYVPSYPKKVDFNTFHGELLDLLTSHTEGCPALIGGDFNAHFNRQARRSTRDGAFTKFLTGCEDDGFRVFPEPGSSVPTFVSSRGATVIDYCFFRGFTACAADSSIRVHEATGHRAVELALNLPEFRVHTVGPRPSYRKHVRMPPPSTFFGSMCRTYGWRGPLERASGEGL